METTIYLHITEHTQMSEIMTKLSTLTCPSIWACQNI